MQDNDEFNKNNEDDLDSNILDEDNLALQFDAGKFDHEDMQSQELEESYDEISEEHEQRVFISALFLSGKPIDVATFQRMLPPLNLENRLLIYAENFNSVRLGIRIRKVSGGYQMVTDSDVTPFLERFFGEKTENLSKAALETLAIVAYRQPVTKVEIEQMREVNSSGTMRLLLDKNLVKVVGRKAVPGKPLLYATTKFFLEYFGLNDLSELPTFREWQELK